MTVNFVDAGRKKSLRMGYFVDASLKKSNFNIDETT